MWSVAPGRLSWTQPMLSWTADEWIAVVDDDESVRRSLERFFHILEIRVRTFAAAEEFLAVVSTPPSCLVLDVQLGTSTGFELRDILANRPLPLPPIIFITARDDLAPLDDMNEKGMCAWLAKPFRAEALLALIEQMRATDHECIASVADARSTA